VDVLADLKAKGQLNRRVKFLAGFDYPTYHRMYETILENPDLQFPDIQALFRVARHHGKIISQVMTHVGQWLNLRPMQFSERDNNKPQLWRDFLLAFCEEHGNRSEELALHLQRCIFSIVHKRIDEFANGTAGDYLSKLPDSQGDAYLERFILPVWKDLLVRVHHVVGSHFQRSLVKFNTQCPKSLPSRPESNLTQVFRDAISSIPEIRLNPALCSSQALEVLMTRIAPIVTDWAVQQGEEALKTQRQTQLPLWPSKARDIVMFQHSQLSAVTLGPNPNKSKSLRYILPSIPSSIAPVPVQSGRHSGESAIEHSPEAMQTCGMEKSGKDKRESSWINRPSIMKILNA
jgi:hypothetical protein